jgi:dihydroxyacetone kinase
MTCTAETVVAALRAGTEAVLQHREELVRLDREIGDADHGENMARGFEAVTTKIDSASADTPGAVLKLAASTLISTGRCTAPRSCGRPRPWPRPTSSTARPSRGRCRPGWRA